ncbi:Polyketide cyclase/dehydrase and lipid transport protein [Abeliophyllum distichum]|uniref:Polyketide cyclase/dehydrase and lipid transport protein n=1 Tax=Abeliophyllum distichum TaxID=126358 RepID=A0ABD1QXF4_9LAMI
MQMLGLPIMLEGYASSFPLPAFLLEATGFGVSGAQSYYLSSPRLVKIPILKSSRHNLLNLRSYVGRNSGNSPDTDNDDNEDDHDAYEVPVEPESRDDGIEIEIEKTGKNSRRIRSKVTMEASLETVWGILTDYERLADFVPGLAVCRLLEKSDNFARIFQIGQQNLAFGLKFNAKGTIDCYEKDLQTLPHGQKRDIEFKMIEGDFQLFEGKWSVEQGVECNTEYEQSGSVVGQDLQTTLLYVVDVEPKFWLPVRLIEGRLSREIGTNLSCIREEAEKVFINALSAH